VIAGPSDDDKYLASLERLIATNDLGGRVELRIGFRPRQEIADLANGALACAYLPIDEDSLGYVTMEAFCAAKPLVTTSDAGGLLEIVRDGKTGFVVAPEAAAVADAFDRFFTDRTRTKEMGHAGRAVLETATLTWDETIARLLN
jgi:glycosyltransferase involved in cell wall biosynthesis